MAGRKDSNGNIISKVNTFILNPKSITMWQLYGQFDALTHEWTDGILSTLIRQGVAAQNDEKKWFVLVFNSVCVCVVDNHSRLLPCFAFFIGTFLMGQSTPFGLKT